MSISKSDLEMVGNAIWRQLGGGRFKVMTGAKNVMFLNEKAGGLVFHLPRMSGVKVNHVKITLNCNDLYDIEFSRVTNTKTGAKWTPIATHLDIYNDHLRELFERVTSLRTSL